MIAGILWGMISLFINALKAAGLHSMQCVAVRCFFTALLLLLYLLIKDRSLLRIRLRDLKFFVGTGLLSIVFFNFCYFQSIEEIKGSAVPALLLYTAPVFVMLFSFFLFGERLTFLKIFALFLTVMGLILVTGSFSGSEGLPLSGILFGLGSGFGYALYTVFGKFVVQRYSALTITAYTFFVAAAVSVPLSGILPQISLLFDGKNIALAAGLALCCTVLPFLFYTKGLSKMEAGKASVIATAEPFTAAVVGAAAFGETFTLPKAAGMLLILLAILLLNLPHGSLKKKGRSASGEKKKQSAIEQSAAEE